MVTEKNEALFIIKAQIDLYTRLRSGMETILRSIHFKSKKGVDQLMRDPSVLLVMESIMHCNEHLDKWKRLLEAETLIIEKGTEHEAQQSLLKEQEEQENMDDEEASLAIISTLISTASVNKSHRLKLY